MRTNNKPVDANATFHGGTTRANEFYGKECGKCGARRIDAQIGLESTVEAYVAELVAVFREVRRVLRDDGVLFLNLGDSYAATASARDVGRSLSITQKQEMRANGRAIPGAEFGNIKREIPSGLKPKDLIGVPWRVAFALQQPYYTGTIKKELDRVWLAAMIDAEGCMFIHKRKEGQHNGQGYYRQNASYGSGLEVANTSEAVVRRCMEITGRGSICAQDKDRRQTLYRWNLRSNECREVIREVYPYLVAKKHQARLIIGCPPSGEKAEAAHEGLILLHNGSETTVDFPEPASMYEPGYYLRSDIVWSKLNPMPESVRDRPTKAHEYIFLLTKSPRYFWDAEAVKEELSPTASYGGTYGQVGKQVAVGNGHAGLTALGRRVAPDPTGRNIRSVWSIATAPFAEAHFATFPSALAERCIKAGTSEKGACGTCGAPWVRVTEPSEEYRELLARANDRGDWYARVGTNEKREDGTKHGKLEGGVRPDYRTTGWQPTCACNAPIAPCVVLDPFGGAGTVSLVAERLGRDSIYIDLSPEYAAMARKRITDDAPLFAAVELA